MSLLRVGLIAIQALGNGLACTPPNPTPAKGRYHTEEMYILQIAPLIFKVHQIIVWICAVFEALYYLESLFPVASVSPIASVIVCSNPRASVQITPMFLLGVSAVVVGSWIRLDCFKTLGQFFTFDLTVHPEHKLVTTRGYAIVRHPAYSGSILLVMGLAFSHLTSGSWLTECGPLRTTTSAVMVWMAWWAWTLAVGVSRAKAEDKQMRKLFPDEWDAYATNVKWWFFPGLI